MLCPTINGRFVHYEVNYALPIVPKSELAIVEQSISEYASSLMFSNKSSNRWAKMPQHRKKRNNINREKEIQNPLQHKRFGDIS